MIRVGKHTVSEEELNKRIINKIPKSQFARIIKSIETDLDKKI